MNNRSWSIGKSNPTPGNIGKIRFHLAGRRSSINYKLPLQLQFEVVEVRPASQGRNRHNSKTKENMPNPDTSFKTKGAHRNQQHIRQPFFQVVNDNILDEEGQKQSPRFLSSNIESNMTYHPPSTLTTPKGNIPEFVQIYQTKNSSATITADCSKEIGRIDDRGAKLSLPIEVCESLAEAEDIQQFRTFVSRLAHDQSFQKTVSMFTVMYFYQHKETSTDRKAKVKERIQSRS